MKKVLIAHQSTIPHYRVSFYNALERLRPDSWRFEVVFDLSEVRSPRYFAEPIDMNQFNFPVLGVRTLTAKVLGKTIAYQTFWRKAAEFDLVIVENAVNNLTYPFCQLHRATGVKLAYWGHGRDRSVEKASGLKLATEKAKIALARRADGFFAYTPGVKAFLQQQGLSPEKVFAVYNTIDINEQREAFDTWYPRRETIRKDLGVQGKKVLLFVGRFIRNKRIGFLLKSFPILRQFDPDFHLLLVGSGGEAYLRGNTDGISYFGPIMELSEFAPIYVASDLFAFPGKVGLGPLQALCYDLPAIAIDSPTHGPEIEYLCPQNSVVLDASTTPEGYAQAIIDLFDCPHRLEVLRQNAWPSIKHLTIERMAQHFIRGVNAVLGL